MSGEYEFDKHECKIYLCCLGKLIEEVLTYACEVVSIEHEQAEDLFELLMTHVEEAWEPIPDKPHPVEEISQALEMELAAETHAGIY